jgi:hypothetical protein
VKCKRCGEKIRGKIQPAVDSNGDGIPD